MTDLSPWHRLMAMDTVIALHKLGIDKYGGDHSPPKENCLEQSLGGAYSAEQYTSTEDSVEGLIFAGYLLFYLVSNHCFVDGNKRIGWLAAMRVLLSLGLTVSATDDEAEEFCMRIADSQKLDAIRDGQNVVIWLSERLEAIPQSRS